MNDPTRPRPMPRLSMMFLIAVVACATGPAAAPKPVANDIVELTYDHTNCGVDPCERIVTVIHRGGGAEREYYTGRHHDSTRVSSIDSVTFQAAAEQAIRIGAARRNWWDATPTRFHSADDWTVIVKTTRRRYVNFYTAPSREHAPFKAEWVRELDGILSSIRWQMPVG